jgi:hypothetical protein
LALAELLPALAVLALVGGEHLAALSWLGVEVIARCVPGQPRWVPKRRRDVELTKFDAFCIEFMEFEGMARFLWK